VSGNNKNIYYISIYLDTLDFVYLLNILIYTKQISHHNFTKWLLLSSKKCLNKVYNVLVDYILMVKKNNSGNLVTTLYYLVFFLLGKIAKYEERSSYVGM